MTTEFKRFFIVFFSHERAGGSGWIPHPQPDARSPPLGGQHHLPPPAQPPGGPDPLLPHHQRHLPPPASAPGGPDPLLPHESDGGPVR